MAGHSLGDGHRCWRWRSDGPQRAIVAGQQAVGGGGPTTLVLPRWARAGEPHRSGCPRGAQPRRSADLMLVFSHDAGKPLSLLFGLRTLHRLRAVNHQSRRFADTALRHLPWPCAIGGHYTSLGSLPGATTPADDTTLSLLRFDPTSMKWSTAVSDRCRTPACPVPGRCCDFVATMLPDGQLLVAGDGAEDTDIDMVPLHLRARDTDDWSELGLTAYWRNAGGALVPLNDGRSVLAMGGCRYRPENEDEFMEASVLRLDTGSGDREEFPPMLQGRGIFVAGLLNDGRVIVAGGYGNDAAAVARGESNDSLMVKSVEIFDPDQRVWKRAADMTYFRIHATACTTAAGLFVVVGGGRQNDPPEVYDPQTNIWSTFPNPDPLTR